MATRKITVSLTERQYRALLMAVDYREEGLKDDLATKMPGAGRDILALRAAWARVSNAWHAAARR